MPLVNSDLWKADFIALKQLSFHPKNPRLPEVPDNASDRQIIEALCRSENIERLAAQIAEKGWLRHDRLIVLKEGRKNIVYEGNRRLCALRLLDNPSLAPSDLAPKFRHLAAQTVLPAKIGVDIVPNVFDAEVVMFSKHTIDAYTVRWTPLQKSAYILSKLEEGITADDLVRSYGLAKADVVEAKASLDLFRIARLAELSPDAQALIDDPQQFPYSVVFERLTKTAPAKEILGYEISPDGLRVKGNVDGFLKVIGRIMEDAANSEIDTRVVSTAKQQREYLQKITRELNYKAGKGSFTADDAEKSRQSGSNTQKPSPNPPPAKKRSSRLNSNLFPTDLVVKSTNEKLLLMVKQGKSLKVSEFPYACVGLLRMVLECGLILWLKKQRHYGKVPVSNAKHGASLNDMLEYVKANAAACGVDAPTKSALESLLSRKTKESKPQLDRIMHAPDTTTTADEVSSIRSHALPLLRVILAAA